MVVGIAIAIALSLFSPTAVENTSYLYILLCGAVGVCVVIIADLSGSYILMLMGNYHLLMVKSINSFSDLINALFNGQVGNFLSGPQLDLLIYFILFLIGSVAGIILFSNIIAWIFKRYHDQTLSLLTGFVLGSLSIIWPWKKRFSTQPPWIKWSSNLNWLRTFFSYCLDSKRHCCCASNGIRYY